jgi:hypothetical protein
MLNIDRNDARKRDISTMMSSCVFVLFVLLVVLVASIRGACESEFLILLFHLLLLM